MTIRVYIQRRPQTLNPPDDAVKSALHALGFTNIDSVRLGRYLDFVLDDARSAQEAQTDLAQMLKKPLMDFPNPVIEVYRVEVIQ